MLLRHCAPEGDDVFWVRTDAPGSNDIGILARAQAEKRILITFDKDFGELAFRFGLPAESGIVLFRIKPKSAAHVARVASASLHSRTCLGGAPVRNIRKRSCFVRALLQLRWLGFGVVYCAVLLTRAQASGNDPAAAC